MGLPVLSIDSQTPISVAAGVASENQITLQGKPVKYAWQFTSTSPVSLTLWGPFPNGVVDPSQKIGLGKMDENGVKVDVGNTVMTSGAYLVEITSPVATTVNLTVSVWNWTHTFFWQIYWRIFG